MSENLDEKKQKGLMAPGALKALYDSFEVKDMSWPDFRRAMNDLIDPSKAMSTLGDVQLQRARQRSNKIRIDNALAGAENLN